MLNRKGNMSRINRSNVKKKKNHKQAHRKKGVRTGGGRNRGRKSRGGASAKKIILTGVFVAFCGVGILGTWGITKWNETRDNKFKPVGPNTGIEDKNNDTDTKDVDKPQKIYDFEESKYYTYDRKRDDDLYQNLLIMGIDGTEADTNIDTRTRTDVMILMSRNIRTNKVNLISIPRDTYVPIQGSETDKINSAHAVGGPKSAAKAVANLLDTEIDGYIKLNYRGFRQFIDAIDGVDVHIDQDMVYDDEGQDLKIRFYKGQDLTLYGEEAEKFIRWRKNNADYEYQSDGSDYSRIQKLQYFLQQVMKKLKNPAITMDLIKIVDAVANNIRHTLDEGELLEFIQERNDLIGSMSMLTLPTIERTMYAPKMGQNQAYMIIDKDNIGTTLDLMHGEGYLNKKYLNIEIENCSGVSGLAANFSNFLKMKGYSSFDLTDGTIRQESKVIVNIRDEYMKKVFSDEVNMENIEYINDPNGEYDVIIKLGRDHEKIKFPN